LKAQLEETIRELVGSLVRIWVVVMLLVLIPTTI